MTRTSSPKLLTASTSSPMTPSSSLAGMTTLMVVREAYGGRARFNQRQHRRQIDLSQDTRKPRASPPATIGTVVTVGLPAKPSFVTRLGLARAIASANVGAPALPYKITFVATY